MTPKKFFRVAGYYFLPQRVKDFVGDKFDYARCPVTGNSVWLADLFSVSYSEHRGFSFHSSALLDEYSDEQIVKVIMEKLRKKPSPIDEPIFSLEEITERVALARRMFKTNSSSIVESPYLY